MDNRGFEGDNDANPSNENDIDRVSVDVDAVKDTNYEAVELSEFSNSPIPEICETRADTQNQLTDSEHASTSPNLPESEGNVSETNENSIEGDSETNFSDTDDTVMNTDNPISNKCQKDKKNVIYNETKDKEQVCGLNNHITSDAVYIRKKRDPTRPQSQNAVITAKTNDVQQNGTVTNKQEFVRVFLERKDDCIILRPMDLIKQGN